MHRCVCASDKQCMIALSEGLLVLGQLFHSTRVCKLTKISGSQYGVIMSNLHVSDHACCFTSGLCTLQVERTLIYIYNYLYSTILLLVHLCVCVSVNVGVFVCRSSSPRSFLKSMCSSECLVVAFLCLHFSTHHFMSKSAFKDDSTAWVSQPVNRLAYKA